MGNDQDQSAGRRWGGGRTRPRDFIEVYTQKRLYWVYTQKIEIRPFKSFPGALGYGEVGVVGKMPSCPYQALG